MRFAPYPEYRATGVRWLDRVPAHWEVQRLKYLATINDEVLPESTRSDWEFQYVDIGSVGANGEMDPVAVVFEDAPSRARRIVRDGDTIVSTVRTYLRAIAPIESPPDDLIVSTGFAVVRPRKLDARYLSYAVRERRFVEEVVAHSVGVSYPATNASALGTIVIPVASPDEQRAIADFLDAETSIIDRLIDRKHRLLSVLSERRSALVTHLVAGRGLDRGEQAHRSATQGKDRCSGLEWLGWVPEHWEIANLRRFARMKTGHTPSRLVAEYWENCSIPWFTLADVWQIRDEQNEYLGATREQISWEGLRNSAAELLPAGTVVLSRTASIGFSGIMPVPMATSQDFWNWVCGPRLAPEYLLMLFRAMKPALARLTMGSTHKTIYQSDAASLRICVPPGDEQRAIVAAIRRVLGTIDALRNHILRGIELLQEYRAALITAAVTGQIDVRGAAR